MNVKNQTQETHELSEISELSEDSITITTASVEPSGTQNFTIFKRIGLSFLELSIQTHFVTLSSHLIPERSNYFHIFNIHSEQSKICPLQKNKDSFLKLF